MSSPALPFLRSLTFLGTSSGVPTQYRNVSGTCLTFADGRVWLFDCGEGTQHQFQKAPSVSVGKVERIFITHMHGDHSYGLPGLMCSTSMMWQAPNMVTPPPEYEAFFGKKDTKKTDEQASKENDEDEGAADAEDYTGPWFHDWFSRDNQYLEVVGPQGLGHYLRTILRASEAGFGYQYRVTELLDHDPTAKAAAAAANAGGGAGMQSGGGGKLAAIPHVPPTPEELYVHEGPPRFLYPDSKGNYSVLDAETTRGITVKAASLTHRVFCCGYAVTEPTAPGALDMAKAAKLGVPKGPLLGKLKAGETITFTPVPEKKRKGEGEEASQTEQEPLAEVTVKPEDCVGAPLQGRTIMMLGDTCDSRNCHTIAQGCDFITHEATFDDASAHLALPRGHSTGRMAGAFAAQLGVRTTLILTHFSARFLPICKDPEPIQRMIDQAKEGLSVEAAAMTSAAAGGRVPASPLPNVEAAEDFRVFDLGRGKAGGAASTGGGEKKQKEPKKPKEAQKKESKPDDKKKEVKEGN